MGPRLCSRGESISRLPLTRPQMMASQWGHGFVAVERLPRPGEIRRELNVAMGPRLCSRGER